LYDERVRAAALRPEPILLAAAAPARREKPASPPAAGRKAATKPRAKPAAVGRPAKPPARQRRSAALRARHRSGSQLAARGSYYRAAPVYVHEERTPPDWGAERWEPSPTLPVVGVDPFSLSDSFAARRGGGRRHRAIDILAPRGTPVIAADDGVIKRVSTSGMAGLYVTQLDRTGQFTYFYAHLDAYVDGLCPGLPVWRGDPLGFVGTTGNAPESCPHLHFAITRIDSPRRWWRGEAINPYPLLAYPPGQ
jgi:murein DD-endopeptidase MepM/ murein hydrolase activator NlpD